MPEDFHISGRVSLAQHEKLFDVYKSMLASKAGEIVLHLENANFFEPFGVCTVAAVLKLLSKSGKKLKVYYNKKKPPANYLKGIGLLEFFGADESTSKSSMSKINLTRFRGMHNDAAVGKLLDVIRNSVSIYEATLDPLFNAFSEIMYNVAAHAKSPVGGFVVGQVYPKINVMRICFVDVGVGIRCSLARNPEYVSLKSDEEAVLLAIEESVTSLPSKHSGLGLSEVAEFVKENEGLMTIISHKAYVEVGHRNSSRELDVGFPGTIVNLKIKLKRQVRKHQMTFEELLDKLRRESSEKEK